MNENMYLPDTLKLHTCKRWEMHTKFQMENLKGRDHSGNPSIDWRVIFKWISGKQGMKMWTEFVW